MGAVLAVVLALLLLPAQPAAAEECGVVSRNGPATGTLTLAELPAGIVRGEMRCGGRARPMAVWTLDVDPTARRLGIRDGPLFRSRPANPLVAVAVAGIGSHARLTLFKRREDERLGRATPGAPDRRPPFRLFGTLCDTGAAEPLDCGTGPRRIKMRADIYDSDGDGALDRVRHEISIWDGGARLQVLMFASEHAGQPLRNAVPWIEVLALTGGP